MLRWQAAFCRKEMSVKLQHNEILQSSSPNNPFHLLTIPLSLSPSLLCTAFWKTTANYKLTRRLLSHSVESRKAWKVSFVRLALSIGSTSITNSGDTLNLPVINQWIIASALIHNISICHKISDAEVVNTEFLYPEMNAGISSIGSEICS